jgi:hypothetical protein
MRYGEDILKGIDDDSVGKRAGYKTKESLGQVLTAVKTTSKHIWRKKEICPRTS